MSAECGDRVDTGRTSWATMTCPVRLYRTERTFMSDCPNVDMLIDQKVSPLGSMLPECMSVIV